METQVNNNCYRKIDEVIKNQYSIGSYQRGYRWTRSNVRELLEDIFEGKLVSHVGGLQETYSDDSDLVLELKGKVLKEVYCLQPLVVKEKHENIERQPEGVSEYSVIDGQQRLTTLYIILKALVDVSRLKPSIMQSFSITYVSRDSSKTFLENLRCDSRPETIDEAYMKEAFEEAREWFLAENQKFCERLKDDTDEEEGKISFYYAKHLRDVILEETQFIWDEIEEGSLEYKTKEQKIFADRNTGKLELTDAELIKSLFMNPEYYGSQISGFNDRQILISEIWDIYENQLHEEEFWRFIPLSGKNKEEFESRTRIDAIYYLLCKLKKLEMKVQEENHLFKAVKYWIEGELKTVSAENKGKTMKACWRTVCDIFDGIRELFEDNEMYNLLSLYKQVEEKEEALLQIYMECLQKNKKVRRDELKLRIKSNLFRGNICNRVKSVRYHTDSAKELRNILIAYNVAITNRAKVIERFGFQYFQETSDKVQWELEHIYSTNEDYLSKAAPEELLEVLKMFALERGEGNEKFYCHEKYLELLYGKNWEKLKADMTMKPGDNEITKCFEKADKRYDEYFDFWRFLRLREIAQDFMGKDTLCKRLSAVLEVFASEKEDAKDCDKVLKELLIEMEQEGEHLFPLIKKEYLYWDDVLEEAVKNAPRTIPVSVKWHGAMVTISKLENFWERWDDESEEGPDKRKDLRNNFIEAHQGRLLRMLYENPEHGDISMENHGVRRDDVVKDIAINREVLRSLLAGSCYRMKKEIKDFFKKNESINPKETYKGRQEDYTTWADFLNDNSFGNLMLLPKEINGTRKYSAEPFREKRRYVLNLRDEEAPFMPVGTLNVLMGKFIDMGIGTEQWLMEERYKYLKDIIERLEAYFGK